MDWQTKMNRAINYIEENLEGEISLDVAARIAECSMWEFQRMFSFVAYTTIGDYIRGRRLSLAAQDLQTSDTKIIDIALKYDYESPAAFSRAFSRLFGISPSSARDEGVIIKLYPKITFQTNTEGRDDFMETKNNMQAYSERGYYVEENAPVYFTSDMDKTCTWFRDVLGWYGDIASRDADGAAEYGCVFDYPGELMVSRLMPFRGIHLFKGESSKGVVGFIMISGLEKFRQLVLSNGWEQISEVEVKTWGAKECRVTTVDGCILRFFETTLM